MFIFAVPSEIDSVPDMMLLSWEHWQVIRPLFHPGKEDEDGTKSCRNEYTAFPIGKS
jgi:hypothetical protein